MKPSAAKFVAHYSIWLATVVTAVMGWMLFDVTNTEIASTRLIHRAQDILQNVSAINELFGRAESAHRAYLLSGGDAFASERNESMRKARDNVAILKTLTSETSAQQQRIHELEGLISTHAETMQEDGRLRAAGGIEAARRRIASGVGQRASARMYEVTAELKRDASNVLTTHRAVLEQGHQRQRNVFIAAVLLTVLLLIYGYLGFTQQRRAREQSEERLRVMADSLPGAMYQVLLSAEGKPKFTFTSAGMGKIRGIDARRSARVLADWDWVVSEIDGRDRANFLAALGEAARSIAPLRQDYRIQHADGTSRCLHDEASLQKQPDGSILMNGYITDITRQRHLEDALHEAKEAADTANRAKSTFLAMMSHEIRTPMNSLLGMLELLSLTKLNGEQRDTLALVSQSSRSLLRIIDDILDFSKIEAGKLDLRYEAGSIKEIIEDAQSIHAANASSKGLVIRRSVDPRISPALLVDPLRLRQILNNLVSNALKFTSGGSIDIEAELVERFDDRERVRITVKDTGAGVAADVQERLFRPFNQGDGGAGQRGGGTGLGLTICRRLADAMGGSVDMQSEPGKGTTMILTLTPSIADARALPKKDRRGDRELLRTTTRMRRMAPTVAKAEAEGTLALVVEDHPTNRALLTRQLRALGYAAESAENGFEALEKWKSGRFGIIITDCNMPEMGGYELARCIRALEATNGSTRTPIIACTANALVGDAELCLAAGMDDCLVKPLELARLLEKLDQWLPIPAKGAAHPVTRAEVPTAAAPLDRSVLAEISGGDPSTERDILTDFRRANDQDVASLKQAMDKRDAAEIARATHRILGASRMVGALELANACEPISQASCENNWEALASGMEMFDRQWVRLNSYFDNAAMHVADVEKTGGNTVVT